MFLFIFLLGLCISGSYALVRCSLSRNFIISPEREESEVVRHRQLLSSLQFEQTLLPGKGSAKAGLRDGCRSALSLQVWHVALVVVCASASERCTDNSRTIPSPVSFIPPCSFLFLFILCSHSCFPFFFFSWPSVLSPTATFQRTCSAWIETLAPATGL